ncbi:MAG: TolC family protein [Acidobacteria bacterium]|nr:TolC family protein [Acidobacteriota bacterium]
MMNRRWLGVQVVIGVCALATSFAQNRRVLTLKEAEEIAVKNHPQVSAAVWSALAAEQVTTRARADYFPRVFGNIATTDPQGRNVLSVGDLDSSSPPRRFSTGVVVSQLVTDFGRTANLTETSELRARAGEETVQATRAEILLEVKLAYLGALRAQSLLKVAEQTVGARQLIVDQVTALAKSRLKSELDVSFANVNLSVAKLALITAQNDVKATFARLSQALGYGYTQEFELVEELLPPSLPGDPAELITAAIRARPDLASLRLEKEAASKFAQAERNLWFPTISILAGGSVVPSQTGNLPTRYGAIGLNINVPVFNGHLFSARHAEADLRARAVEQKVRDTENRLARDVMTAWLNSDTEYRHLQVTGELLEQATKALDLAQARYDLGLGSIVELSQAELNKTSAEIAVAGTKYEYQIQRAVLDYQMGALH